MTELIVVFAMMRTRLKSWEAIKFSGIIFLRRVNISHVRHNSNATVVSLSKWFKKRRLKCTWICGQGNITWITNSAEQSFAIAKVRSHRLEREREGEMFFNDIFSCWNYMAPRVVEYYCERPAGVLEGKPVSVRICTLQLRNGLASTWKLR